MPVMSTRRRHHRRARRSNRWFADGVAVLARVWDHGHHGTEDLFRGNTHLVSTDQDGRLVVEALDEPVGALRAADNLSALFDGGLHEHFDPVAPLRADQRSQVHRGVDRVADLR